MNVVLKKRFKAMNRMRKSKEDALRMKQAKIIANKKKRMSYHMTDSGLNDRMDATSFASSS